MDIFDDRFYVLHKRISEMAGLWPNDQRRTKFIRRAVVGICLVLLTIPHFIGFYVNIGGNIDKLLEQVALVIYTLLISLKFLSSIINENKFKKLYEAIATNWKIIVASDERSILIKHSEMGRFLTVAYLTYMVLAMLSFMIMPLTPLILNIVMPLEEPRSRIFISNDEFFIDRNENYGKIYTYECIVISITGLAYLSLDSLYIISTEHCFGLIAIVKYRLQTVATKDEVISYTRLVETIRFHVEVLKFASLLEDTFSKAFLFFMSTSLTFCSTTSLLVLMSIERPYDLIRYVLLYGASAIHLFYISWPGQRLMSYSSDLYESTYCSEWYNNSPRSKKLLNFMMLRCSKPCLLTAGGIYVMGFENFVTVMRASFSFITLLSSFRYSDN